MRPTCEMLQASTKKAVELGLLPRRAYIEDLETNAEIMQQILQAALDTIPHTAGQPAFSTDTH
jgi:hypothetical protein